MNNINELIAIIDKNDGSASLEEIVSLYGKEHHMIMFAQHKIVVQNTLNASKDKVYFDSVSGKWLLLSKANKPIPATQEEEEAEKTKFLQWLSKTHKANTIRNYVRAIKKLSDILINEKRISSSLFLNDDMQLFTDLYNETLHGNGELHEINVNNDRTWSSAIKLLKEMREEQLKDSEAA